MKLILKILRSERGSVGIGAALLTAGAGAATSVGVGALGKAISGSSVVDPVTGKQIQQDRDLSLDALQQQQQFTGGLQNAGDQGLQAQQQLLSALQLQAQGGGPNPAAQALSNATGANVANQAALMAGQRGASANAGLIGRQAAMQGAQIQQDASGQAALMQAQQQLAAQGMLGQQANQQVSQQGNALGALNQSAQGLQGMGLSAGANANNAKVASNKPFMDVSANAIGGALGNAGAGMINQALPQKKAQGGKVQGDESELIPGDHEENDTVPTLLSPGEIVIPRSYASDPKAAAAFAHACALFAKKD